MHLLDAPGFGLVPLAALRYEPQGGLFAMNVGPRVFRDVCDEAAMVVLDVSPSWTW
jgi:hypothetical protein